MNSLEYIFNIIKSGSSEIISESDLKHMLFKKKNLIIKAGFDPTSKNLHLGHFIILKKLRQFQDLGYFVYFIIGDFTAMIGDPTGRINSRKFLNKNEIINNYKSYSKQIFKILNPFLTKIYFNSLWLNELNINSLLNLMCSTNITKILERSDFKNRYNSNRSINMNEFIYPFLQGYDSVFIESDIEVGGIDQKLNFLLSRDLQKKYNQKPQSFIMMPILTGLDGNNKMSKSLNNCINFLDSPYDIFCKVMSIPDNLISEYFVNLFFLSKLDYLKKFEIYKNPMDIKKKLAYNIVSNLYNEKSAIKSEQDFVSFFSEKKILEDINVINLEVSLAKVLLFDVLYQINFITSISDFKRFLKFKSVKVNNIIIVDKKFFLESNNFYFIQIGKIKFIKIFLKKK